MFKKDKFYHKNRISTNAFTLIELMIVVFIFSAVILISSLSIAQAFMFDRLKSTGAKDINREITPVMETIGIKMANANSKQVFNIAGADDTVYGFGLVGSSPEMLVFSHDNSDCTFIAKIDKKLYQVEKNCSVSAVRAQNELKKPENSIISDQLDITGFDVSADTKEYDPTSANKIAPYLTVKITAKSIKTGAQTTFQSTYGLEYGNLIKILE